MEGSQLFVIVILIGFSALFSMIETSFLSVSLIRANALKREKKPGADALYYLKQKPQRLLIMTLLGNTVVNFTAVVLATLYLVDLIPNGALIATLAMTILVLLFGQIIPKVIAEKNATSLALFFSRPISGLIRLSWPIVFLLDRLATFMSKRFQSKESLSQDELQMFIHQSKQDNVLSKETALIMTKVLESQNTTVAKLMTPKKAVYSVESSQKISSILKDILKNKYSHIPIYEKHKENIVGVVSTFSLLKAVGEKKSTKQIKTLGRDPLFIPDTRKVEDLMPDLIQEEVALIVNEYGSFVGLITLPDILSAIFTTEERQEQVKRAVISGKTTLAELNKMFNVKFEGGTINTIAGYITQELQKIPETGEKFQIKSLNFSVEKATKKEIVSLKVWR